MSRGRKPQMGNNCSSSDYVFKKNVGSYIQAIAIALASEHDYQCDDASEVLNHVRSLNKKKYPTIRDMDAPFTLPKNWVWCRLGEICDYGSSPKAEPKELKSDTWVLDLEDIEKDTSILLHKIRFSTRNSLSTKSVFKKGEVLYSKLRPYLDKVIVADEDGVCTTEILPLKIYGKINPYFLRLMLKCPCFLSYVNGVTKGMKMPRLGTKEGQNAVIPLPPISEQDIIVAFVNDFEANRLKSRGNYFNATVEQKIIELHNSQLMGLDISSELTNQLSLVKKLRLQLLQDAVQGKLLPQDKNDEPTIELLKKVREEKDRLLNDKKVRQGKLQEAELQDDILFNIPHNWEWCKLDELCTNITDGTHQTPTYTTFGKPFISAQHVKPFKFTPDNKKYISEEAYLECIKNKKPRIGDLLVTRVGAIGEAAVIEQEFDFAFYVSLALIQPFKKYVSPKYLELVINSPYGNVYSKGNVSSKGSSAGNFNLGRIRSFLIPLPPLAEQYRIITKLEELMQTCDELEESILSSKRKNDQLLQQVLREALKD